MAVIQKLDKRIKDFSDIQSEVCYDNSFVGEVGYFADSLSEFGNLYTCNKGTLSVIAEEDDDLIFGCKNGDEPLTGRDWYEFFIPEKLLKPIEKKYRPYSLAEWIDQHEIGEVIHYRSKSGELELRQMYVGTRHSQGIKKIIEKITLGEVSHTLDYLFEDYEIEVNGEWLPFGVLDNGEEE